MQAVVRLIKMGAFLLPTVWLCLSAFATDNPRQPRPASELCAAGSDEMLWISLSEWDQDHEEFITRLWYRQSQSEHIVSPQALKPQLHRVAKYAVAGEVFDVFFDSGVYYRYSVSRGLRSRQLPGRSSGAGV